MTNKRLKVTIVGGGPVGLFLGICLSKADIECTILEKRMSPVVDSRSLGIHPISLELFDSLNIVHAFLEKGIQIKYGVAYGRKRKLGQINFSDLEKPYNFILACPQYETEQILADVFKKLNPNALIRNAEVTAIQQNENRAICRYSNGMEEKTIESDYIIGCDGKNSFVRQEAGIFFDGKRYPDTYIMGDFEDNTDFGSKAAVFLPKEGMIECFPLPNGMRRWVVKTDSFISNPSQQAISEYIQKRLGYDLYNLKNTMLSSFGVQHFKAEQFFDGRILLCGDSAHVVSPIGGQGMNLGWIGAWKLSKKLEAIQNYPEKRDLHLTDYHKELEVIVDKAALRAEWNMKIGRKQRIPFLRRVLVFLLLNSPLSKLAARQFAMRNLFSIGTSKK